jgi:phospholipid/cholesterol/gamma-HCH transport system substrate-binding protein
METRANYVLVGGCVLGALAAIAAFIFWLGASRLSHQEDTYYTYFAGSVAGLSAGSPVRYRGVPVGTVGNIEIDSDNIELIRVTLKMNAGTPVKIDTVASLEMAGITGGSYIELSGGTQGSPRLKEPDDDKIPIITAKNSSLQALVNDAPKLLGKLSELADSANKALSAENVKQITDILTNLRNMTDGLNGMTPELKTTVGNFNSLVADLHKQIPVLMNSVQQDTTSVKGAADEFRQVADNINTVISENRGPLRDFTGNGLSEATGLISQLRSLTETLTRVANRLDRDPQRYLFGGTSGGVDPNRPIGAGVPTGASR